VCRRTVAACRAGRLTECEPGAPVSAIDGCNGEDDDCDGSLDEDCPTCIKVTPTGDDASASQSNGATPFRSLQAAVDFADTHRGVSTRVCVAAGDACGASSTYAGPGGAPLVMRNGISVLGKYEATTWTRCANSTTTLAPQTGAGVSFPAAVQSETALDGFRIDRFAAATTAAVSVAGAHGVRLSALVVENSVAAQRSYGIDVSDGGEAHVVRSRITSGLGDVESIAVRAVDSRVVLEENCSSFDADGRCNVACGTGTGISSTNPPREEITHYTVLLRNSPDSRIERNAVCLVRTMEERQTLAAVRVEGDAHGVVIRGNAVEASTPDVDGPMLSTVSLADCAGASPWIVDNHSILAVAADSEDIGLEAILTSGDCHPVVDANLEIANVMNGRGTGSVVRCAAAGGVASRCVISGNPSIYGAGRQTTPDTSLMPGVRCEAGSCAKISRNTLVARRTHPRDAVAGCSSSQTCRPQGTGLVLDRSGAFVDRNVISGGCSHAGSGIEVVDSWSRIQNNRVSGRDVRYCDTITPNPLSLAGVHVSVGASNEFDLHSNTIRDEEPPSVGSSCSPASAFLGGLLLDVTPLPPSGPLGIVRNNFISACGTNISERAAAADPRFVENNYPFSGFLTVYLNDGVMLQSVTAVNAMTDTTASGNTRGTVRDVGTSTGAPLWDFEGKPRDTLPDIGHLESRP
jgi:hypothetical protein